MSRIVNEVHLDEAAIAAMFRDRSGFVADFLGELADDVASVARAVVQVRQIPDKYHTGRTSNAKPPGYTKARITTRVGNAVTYGGLLFGGAQAPENPGLFLELPAIQVERKGHKFPFLSTGLDSLWVG